MSKISLLPVLDNPTGDELLPVAVQDGTRRSTMRALVDAAAGPSLAAASQAADRAAGYALTLQTSTAGGWYDSLADGAASADVAEGEGYFVADPAGRFLIGHKQGGVGVQLVEFLTTSSLRPLGVNVMDMPGIKGDGVADDTQPIMLGLQLAQAMGVELLFPGPGYTFLIGGAFEMYGTFTSPHGDRPFPRGIFPIVSGMRVRGGGCTIKLSGGRSNPGSLFYQRFWLGGRVTGVRFSGLVLDGNLAEQTIEAYPPNTPDTQIWQHGHAIAIFLGDDVIIEDVTSSGWRGNDVSFFGTSTDPVSTGLTVRDCRFPGSFGIAVAGGASADCLVENCRFSGDGFWVGAISIEILGPDAIINNWTVRDCTFDFRAGLAPVEATPSLASDSPAAAAARRHLRRAIVIIKSGDDYPGGIFNGAVQGLRVEDCTVFQGVIEAYNADAVAFERVRIYNEFEDLTDVARIYVGPHAILCKTDDAGIGNTRLVGCEIDSDLEGYGAYLRFMRDIEVDGNVFRRSRQGGYRQEACAGHIGTNSFRNTGGPRTADQIAADPTTSCALVLFGGQSSPLVIDRQIVVDDRAGAARGVRHAIYANLAADPVAIIDQPVTQGLLDTPIQDVNRAVLTAGYVAGAWNTNAPVALDQSLTVNGGGVTISNAAGGATIELHSAAGTQGSISYFIAGKLRGQIAEVNDGNFNFNLFDENGAPVGTPFVISNDGHLRTTMTWQTPLEVAGVGFLWISAAGVWRTSPGRPAADRDGVAVGAQS